MVQKNDALSEKKKAKRDSIYKTALSLLGFLVLALTGQGMSLAEKIPEETVQKLRGLRIPFIMNQGQVDPQVKFYARTFSGVVYVTEEGRVVYELPKDKERKWVLVEEAVEGLAKREIKGEGPSKTQVNYFRGNDRTKWQSGLPTHETVDLGEVYQGIKLKLRAYGGSVEKLFYISPGKEPKEIRVRVKGAESLKVTETGELEVQTSNGPVIFSRPRAFQKQEDRQENVPVAYWVDGDQYGFKVEGYDKTRELIIDPLIQSTYLGGSYFDYVTGLAVSGGNVYVAGINLSGDFPGTTGGAQPAAGGYYDGFVALLSGDLKQIIQSTYLGGIGGNGYLHSLAVSGGNVYAAGSTLSSNFPGTAGGAQPAFGGGDNDGFVALLSGDLKQLIQSTYLGGNGDEAVNALAVSGGNVYAAGDTYYATFPGTAGGAQPSNGGGTDDGFVALLSGDLKQLIQSTYLGGSGGDVVTGLAVSGGNVYVAGYTGSSNFPGTAGGAQSASGRYWDGFVALLSGDLKQLIQSTYLGGSGMDYVNALAVSGGNVYVAGYTDSSNFPGTAGGPQPAFGGGDRDGFVALLSGDLKQLIQSTYLGGNIWDYVNALAVSGGNVYAAGKTNSSNFPGTAGGAQPTFGGDMDGFVTLLSADLKMDSLSFVLTGSAGGITSNSATLNGIVYAYDLSTTVTFEYGLTTAYGTTVTADQSPVAGISDTAVSKAITGLTPNTTYHYRVVATNSAGTTYGEDMIFKTQIPGHGDHDGDGKTDLAVWRPSDGNWYILRSIDGTVTVKQWGTGTLFASSDVPVPGDYDGDGKTDITVWRPSDGNWYILRSSDGAVTATSWGTTSDIPVIGDYDGDGKMDLAVWRPTDGNWYIINSSTGAVTIRQWGTAGDIPVPGDYDGDGKTDMVVWRPSDGNWYILRSIDGAVTVTSWGSIGDKPVPGDYDGDGKTDLAVWRPSDGNWYILNSSTGAVTVRQWGTGTVFAKSDVPVPGDYDGDGKTDIAVWRPGDGRWYILRSSDGGVTATQWGAGSLNDVPIAESTLSYRYLEGSLY